MGFSNGQDKIEIIVEVDSKGAAKILGEVGKQVEGVGESSKQASEGLTGFQKSLIASVTAAATAVISFKTVQGIISTISRGSQVDDVTQSFSKLSAQAGATSSVLISKLQTATAGTISNFDLMKQANELLLAGIKPEIYDQLAQSARALSEVTGGELKDSFATISDSLLRGNDRALKAIGIHVDLTKAQEDFAKSIGVTSDRLNEAGQIEANRIAIQQALIDKNKELGKVEDDAGDRVQRLSAGFENLKDSFASSLAQNQNVNDSLDEFKKILDQVNVPEFASSIGALAKAFSDLASVAIPFATKSLTDFANGVKIVQLGLKEGITFGDATAIVQVQNNTEALKKLNDAGKALKELGPVDKFLVSKEDIEAESKAIEKLKIAIAAGGDQAKQTYGPDLKKAEDNLKGWSEKLKPAAEDVKKFINTIKNSGDQLKTGIEGLQEFDSKVKQLISSQKSGIITLAQYDKAMSTLMSAEQKAGQSAVDLNRIIGLEQAAAFKDADAQVEEYKKHLAEVASESPADKLKQNFTEALNSVFGGDVAGSLGMSAGGLEQLGLGIGDAVANGLENGFNRDTIKDAASSAGAAVGAEFGIPFCDVFARMVADSLSNIGVSLSKSISGLLTLSGPIGASFDVLSGGMIDSVFGDSAKDKARKQADAFFADVFKDLTFSGNQDPLSGVFSTMSADAQAQFTVIGDALTTALKLPTDQGLNLGVVLANNNITLSEMSAIIEATGQSFDTLSQSMYQAFFDGQLSVLDLQNQLEQLMGIIDGSSAFDNLGAAVRAALSADGRQLLGAIKSIGIEAEQTGITLGQMPDILVNKFGIAANQVQQIMAAMTAAGIKSVSELANASQSVLTAVGANIAQAKDGVAPDNVAVIKTQAATSGSGGSRGGSSAPRQTSSRPRTDPNDKIRASILAEFNKVQNSGAVKDLDALVASNQISDLEYAKRFQAIVDQDRALETKITDAQKKYAEDVRKGSRARFDDLTKLNKLKDDLAKSLASTATKDTPLSRLDEFAKKFAGNIDLIQRAAKALNVSFRDMKQQALDAFLAGSKTFAQAQDQIDEASGGKDVKKNLDKFRNLGANGGAYSVTALQNIAKAALNTGATSIDNLAQQLLGGGADTGQVQELMIAFQNSGVNSLDQIANAGTDLVVKIGSQLQDLKFPFAETTSSIRDELLSLDKLIQESRKVVVDADVIISPDLRAILELAGKPVPSSNSVDSGSAYKEGSPGVKSYHKFTRVSAGVYRDQYGKLTSSSGATY